MAIEKQKIVDQIIVAENGIILYREAIRVIEDGKMLAQTYHRHSLAPDQETTGHPTNVVAIAQAAWTPEIVAAYEASQAGALEQMFPAQQ